MLWTLTSVIGQIFIVDLHYGENPHEVVANGLKALSEVVVKDATMKEVQNLFDKMRKKGKKDDECDDLENNMSILDFFI